MNENVIQYNYSYKLSKKANDYNDEDLYNYLREQFIQAKEINIDSNQKICNLITLSFNTQKAVSRLRFLSAEVD